jgi:archaetidylinositol phosphate synthase
VLNNLRNKFDPMLEKVGIGFASLGFGPSFWTWVGLLLSIISAIMFSLHSPAIGVPWYTATVLGGIFLLIAGFFDAVDGAVARATKKTSALGSFLDSVIDKVSEIIVFVGILIGSFTNPVLVLVALSLSILVSYTRAKAESMGVDLKGKGIAERAERILIISILAFIPFQDNISVALWIVSILAIITVLERLKVVSAIFGVSLFSIQAMRDIFKREIPSNTGNFSPSGIANNTTSFSDDQSSSSKVSSTIKEILNKPSEIKKEIKKDIKTDESKPSQTRKAMFIDRTDPNETGRNTDQIISALDAEDRKTLKTNTAANQPNLKKDNNKPQSPSKTTDNTTTTTTTTTSSASESTGKKDENEKTT